VEASSESTLLLEDRPTSPSRIFEVEQQDETLLIIPTTNLGDLVFQEIEAGASDLLDRMKDSSARNAILDFRRTDYFGSSALGFLLKLLKAIQDRSGRLALCNLSEHEQEILRVTKLDGLCAICASREEALQFVGRRGPSRP
jgi:anti-anti-sigma factor